MRKIFSFIGVIIIALCGICSSETVQAQEQAEHMNSYSAVIIGTQHNFTFFPVAFSGTNS